MKTRTEFFIKILAKEIKDDDTEKIENAILIQSYKILLENYAVRNEKSDSYICRNYDLINRGLLMAMENKYGIRTSYEKHLDVLMRGDDNLVSTSEMHALVGYIENLYGYKNYELLVEFVASVYDEVKGKTIIITATSTDMKKHGKPDTNVLREIRNYSRYVSTVDSVRIIIDSKALNPENKSVIVQKKHSVSFAYHDWGVSSILKDGTVWDTKPTFLSF
ncbi:hypothetical protein [Clostridium estertheticum]|uniref:hypothetical protein n=1 Tax=Clostridium estertheticum TaxID=238834 RepID=UPI001C7CC807|nr:hypothetical protein [Clostridium estertheticum]MBX4265900.1 hypothetical protein [Clostridium estertheticum]WLC90173.1 hypothetical protein KTC95_08320 [Clostridium estertheticum]